MLAGGLAATLGGIYLQTLLPGVGAGDTAELQYMSARFGVCHAPGYVIEVVFGRVFDLLPFGPGTAWRVNLMMAVSGVVGCLALFGAVSRVTGSAIAGALAAGILGLSSIYWSYAIAAEAYVFFAAFLLIGVYALVRFVQGDRAGWLYAAALGLGTCIAGRPSELGLLPGFVALLFWRRRGLTLKAGRIATATALLLLPFAVSVGLTALRAYPVYMPTEEPLLASEILSGEPLRVPQELGERLGEAAYYSLGIGWSATIERGTVLERIAVGVPRILHLLVGGALLSGAHRPPTPFELEHGVGVSLGMPGLLLAVLGAAFYWRTGWPLLGLGLFVGNAAFYFWYQTYESLTYTVPGISGLAFLAGMGIAGPRENARPKERWALAGVGALTVVLLLFGNYRVVDRSGSLEPLGRPHMSVEDARRLPRDSRLLMDHWHASTYRYVLHVEAGRTDVQVLATDLAGVRHWDRIVSYLKERDRPAFVLAIPGLGLDPRAVRALRRRTPPALARFGFILVHDPP